MTSALRRIDILDAILDAGARRQLHTSAKPIALGDRLTTSATKGENRNTNDVMGNESGNAPGHGIAGPSVHACKPAQYRPHTEDQAVAFRLLKSVPGPLTIGRVARALVWPRHRARRWVHFFEAKGALVKVPESQRWLWRDAA